MADQDFQAWVKRFRYEHGLYWSTPPFRQGNLFSKQFGRVYNEMPSLATILNNQFFNTHLISQLLHTVKSNDIPAARKLFNEVIALKEKCKACPQQAPDTNPYYRDRLTVLVSLTRLLKAFNQDFDKQVYHQLNTYYTEVTQSVKSPVADSRSLTALINLTEFYLNKVYDYCHYFTVIWRTELYNEYRKGIRLVSDIADHLQAVIANADELIAFIEKTKLLLLSWKDQMEIKEQQELYN